MADVDVIRRALVVLFLFGALGTGAELLLLEHTEGVWQKAPLLLIAAGCAVALPVAVRPARTLLRLFQTVMGLFLAAGVAGVVLHYRGNMEFERELRPGVEGFELIREAMMGATPALAPGTMILLALVGLTSTYGHPSTRRRSAATAASPGGLT